MRHRIIVGLVALAALLGLMGSTAQAAPTPASTPSAGASSGDSVQPSNYILNGSSAGGTFGAIECGSPCGAWWALYPGENTQDALDYFYAYGVAYDGLACADVWYNSGQLGWTFWKRIQFKKGAGWWYVDIGFNYKVAIHKNIYCPSGASSASAAPVAKAVPAVAKAKATVPTTFATTTAVEYKMGAELALGNCSPLGCGVFKNTGTVGFGIIHCWCSPDLDNKYQAILQPGVTSNVYFKDTDGVYVGPGYCLKVGRWNGSSYTYSTATSWGNSPGAFWVGQWKFSDYTYVYHAYVVRC